MLSLSVGAASVKLFMNRLLRENIFDSFETRSVEITARTRILISGELSDEAGGFIKWAEVKPLVTEIIKSGGKPRGIKIIFCADSGVVASVHENAKVLFLNLVYENGGVAFTTATSQKQFALDKTLDAEWDAYIKKFFAREKIEAVIS